MDTTRLGESDLHVSKICLGTMTFGEQNTEAEATSNSTIRWSAVSISLTPQRCTR